MSDLDEIIDIQISVSDKAVSVPNFGTPMLFGYHTAWTSDFVREYSQADDMLTDGFSASHYLYKAALAIKAQDPCPKTFKIGRRSTSLTQIVHMTPTITRAGHVYTWTIAGHTGSYTVGGGATIQIIVEAIQPTIDAYAEVTATEDNTKIVVTAAAAGAPVDFAFGLGWNVSDETADTTTDDDLPICSAEDDDWYGLLIADSTSKATTLLGAAFCETKVKEYIAQTPDTACGDSVSTTDVMAAVQTAAYKRTIVGYHRSIAGSEWLAAAWMGRTFSIDPGRGTMAFRTLAGVSADDPQIVNASFRSSVLTKSGSYYIRRGGVNITFEGKAGSGRFGDITRFVDWQQADMQTSVYGLIVNQEKLPYTDGGISQIKGTMLQSLQRGVTVGGLAAEPAPEVTVLAVADQAANDRALRIARGFEFKGRLAGAIHRAVIRGNLSV